MALMMLILRDFKKVKNDKFTIAYVGNFKPNPSSFSLGMFKRIM